MTAHIDHKGTVKTLLQPTKPGYIVTEVSGRSAKHLLQTTGTLRFYYFAYLF